ncbi:MFS transporter [Natronohydrobacter thiooxidans]|uniref:MFS transporter n=1 Tax=Natronohydrobacter thiooxidans TaxID=87172 RepID=UPI001FE63CDF|nr:MFS transporter [Natronohydrobacter thiooxidans]
MILLLWTTGLLVAWQFAKVTLTLDSLQTLYPGSPVAYAVSGVALIGILGGAMAGFVVARFGLRHSVLWACGLSAVLALAQGLELPFRAYMILRIAEGVGHLLFVVALPTLMASRARAADKSVVMGLWGTFFGVGYALMAVIVPPVEAWGGLRAVFVGHGLLLVAVFPLLWWVLPRGIMGVRDSVPNPVEVHRRIYTNPRLAAAGLGHGTYTALFIALVAFLPAAMGAMWLFLVLPVANLLGTFAAGFLSRRVAAPRIVVWGFGISALLFATMAISGLPAIAVLAFLATGVVAGGNFAAVPMLNDAPRDQALANGAMAQLGNIGTFSGTPLFAFVAGSLWGLAGLSIAICMFGVIAAGFVYRTAGRG